MKISLNVDEEVFLKEIKERYYVDTIEEFLELDMDEMLIDDIIKNMYTPIPIKVVEMRNFIGQDEFTAAKRLMKLFPEKEMIWIDKKLKDYERFSTLSSDGTILHDIENIEEKDIKEDIIYGDYPVYKVIRNDVVSIAGTSNVGKSYHASFILSLMSKDVSKLYCCPDQGIPQCANMLKGHKVKNCLITESSDLNTALKKYKRKKDVFPDVVVFDMLSSLEAHGRNPHEEEANRIKLMKKFKKEYPKTTFIFIVEVRKTTDGNAVRPTLDSIKGNNGLIYKSDLVICLYKYTSNDIFIVNLKGRLTNAMTKDVHFKLGKNIPQANKWAIEAKPIEVADE